MYRVSVEPSVHCAVEDLNPRGGRAILFVHGWPLAKEIFEQQCNVLPDYGIRCIRYDLRGFGDSDKPLGGYSYDCLADDLHRIIQSIDCRCLTLCGFSMGGAICVRYMARYRGDRVNRLILCGAAAPSFTRRPGFSVGMATSQVDALIDQAYRDRPQLCDSFGRMCFAGSPSEAYLRWFADLGCKASGTATIQTALSLRDEDLRPDLYKICVPTAIFHGTQDQVCPFALAEEMHRGIPRSYLVPFEHSGHDLLHDEWEKCNREIVSFLGSI